MLIAEGGIAFFLWQLIQLSIVGFVMKFPD
jgi:hypothetical protein